jgi:hypothetical protein
MPVGFIPRSVAKKRNTTKAVSSQFQGSVPIVSTSTRHPSIVSATDTELSTSLHLKKEDKKFNGDGLAVLLECALRNYALWLQPDLQRYPAPAATEGCPYFLIICTILL